MTAARRPPPGATALTLLLSSLLLGSFASWAADQPTPAALQSLQGTWESVDPESAEKTTITIEGNTLYFYKDADFWWDTTFTLPGDREPPHLHATILRPEKHTGDEVIAFFKVENGMLTLAGVRSPESYDEWPTSVETAESQMAGRYELRKVQPKAEQREGG